MFRVGPLVEARFVDIVATCSTTPGDLLFIFELHAADGTVILECLAVTILRLVAGNLRWQSWCVGEYLLELGSEKCILLLQVIWGLEDVVENVQSMFAQLLLALANEYACRTRAAQHVSCSLWTSLQPLEYLPSRNVRDGDSVDISSGSSNLDRFDRAVMMIGMAVLLDTALAIQNEHSLSFGTL